MQKLQRENMKILEYLGIDRKFSMKWMKILLLQTIILFGGNQIIEKDDFYVNEINPVKQAFGCIGYNEYKVKDKEIYHEDIITKANISSKKMYWRLQFQ